MVQVAECNLTYTRMTLVMAKDISIKHTGGRLNHVVIWEGETPLLTLARETTEHPPFSELRRKVLGISMKVLSGRTHNYTYVSPGRKHD